MGVSMFVNDAFIGDVTAPARGTDVVVLSACMTRLVTSFVQDRLATVPLAGAFIFMGGFLLSDWLGWLTAIRIPTVFWMPVSRARNPNLPYVAQSVTSPPHA